MVKEKLQLQRNIINASSFLFDFLTAHQKCERSRYIYIDVLDVDVDS